MSDWTTELLNAPLVQGAHWRRKRGRIDPETREIHFDLVCADKRLLYPHCASADQSINCRQLRDRQHLRFFRYRELVHAAITRVGCWEFGARGDDEVQHAPVAMHFLWSPLPREYSGLLRLFEVMVSMSGARGCALAGSVRQDGARMAWIGESSRGARWTWRRASSTRSPHRLTPTYPAPSARHEDFASSANSKPPSAYLRENRRYRHRCGNQRWNKHDENASIPSGSDPLCLTITQGITECHPCKMIHGVQWASPSCA